MIYFERKHLLFGIHFSIRKISLTHVSMTTKFQKYIKNMIMQTQAAKLSGFRTPLPESGFGEVLLASVKLWIHLFKKPSKIFNVLCASLLLQIKLEILPFFFSSINRCSFAATLNSKNIPGIMMTIAITPVAALTQLQQNKSLV